MPKSYRSPLSSTTVISSLPTCEFGQKGECCRWESGGGGGGGVEVRAGVGVGMGVVRVEVGVVRVGVGVGVGEGNRGGLGRIVIF